MRENLKSAGLVLALVIAGVSLPTSIMSFTNKPTTPINETNNYYYNNTVIERYNNTIIVWINNTVVVNETVVEELEEPMVNRTRWWRDYDEFTYSQWEYQIIDTYELGTHELYFYECIKYDTGVSPILIVIDNRYLADFIEIYQLQIAIDLLPCIRVDMIIPLSSWTSGSIQVDYLANYTVLFVQDNNEINKRVDFRDSIYTLGL